MIGLTANIAQMVGKMGEGLKIHMSGASKHLLDSVGGYRCEYRGILDMGVKLGEMETYWLLGPDLQTKNPVRQDKDSQNLPAEINLPEP